MERDPNPSLQLGVGLDPRVERRVEALAIPLETEKEGLVVDAADEERHLVLGDVDEPAELGQA